MASSTLLAAYVRRNSVKSFLAVEVLCDFVMTVQAQTPLGITVETFMARSTVRLNFGMIAHDLAGHYQRLDTLSVDSASDRTHEHNDYSNQTK
jgi:hypothetical protein